MTVSKTSHALLKTTSSRLGFVAGQTPLELPTQQSSELYAAANFCVNRLLAWCSPGGGGSLAQARLAMAGHDRRSFCPWCSCQTRDSADARCPLARQVDEPSGTPWARYAARVQTSCASVCRRT